ncbi:putative gustatory receptor 36a [Drosophila bipectinata]|uniref:putative gustatory receptor 36a n=1 Tax=Drosophila bipectinata TaxID=42026 RepID=UPI001C8A09E4|nr:putative gustatory receptor 36a [Drosophila bipectinata]
MFDWVGWLLRAVYIYGFLIGVSNFEIDWRAGRVLKSIRSTAYAATINILTVLVLGFQVGTDTNLNVIFGNANKLHEYVIIVMSVLRIISGLTVLLTRWQQRCKLMTLVRILFRLYLEKPQIKRMSRWAILTKTITVTLKDFLQIALALEALGRLGARQALGMYMQFGMAALMSYALSQHYLIMLFVRVEYQILNSELEQVIEESCWLSYHSPRNGVFMTKCCYLADRLEDIGKRQDEVQSIVTYLGEVFAVQGLLAFTENYISSVGTTYLIFSLFKYGRERLGMPLNAVIFSICWCFFHYLDSFRSHFLMLSILDEHRRMAGLLKKSSMFAPGLDVRLEQSFETYLFQLARNPLKMHVMQMFPISHTFTTAMFGSIAMNSIYLIQYDMENF